MSRRQWEDGGGLLKMAALSEDGSYGLKSGPGSAHRVSVLHVKLTESALRAVETFHRVQNGACVQPTIQFKGLQGRIKIPRSDSSELQSFEFYLSNVAKDNPQGRFECLQQNVAGSSPGLSLLAPVQTKLTVCATNDSYQTTREKMTQAVEDTKERCTKVIKPGGQFRWKQVQIRKPVLSGADVVPERKRSTPINPANTLRKCLSSNPVSQRPLRDRVLHLLALRPYKKLELLARLQRDGISQKDRATLGTTLQQVAVLNTKENSYSLKEFVFGEVQREWPGYTEEERTQAERNVTRKLGVSSEPLPSNSSPKDSAPSCSPQKLDFDFIDPLAPKKPRISHLSNRTSSSAPPEEPASHRSSSAPSSAPSLPSSAPSLPSSAPSLPSSAPSDRRAQEHPTHRPSSAPSSHRGAANHQLSPASSSHSPSTPEGCGTQDLPLDQSSSCRDPSRDRTKDRVRTRDLSQSPSSYRGGSVPAPSPREEPRKAKKKSKKHKEKDREKKETREEREESRAPPGGDAEGDGRKAKKRRRDEQRVQRDTDKRLQSSEFSSSPDLQDYLLKYVSLASLEQRQKYKLDFNSEYDEYRLLHARVEGITRRFTQLDAQCRSLTPGTLQHQKVQEEVLREYKKIKQLSPNFQEEKQRCEYLHNKLSHIKRLISDFDHKRAQSWS